MTYTIKTGDTLGTIAKRFLGDSGRYREIASLNGITNPNLIKLGQVIRIPTQSATSAAPVSMSIPVATAAPAFTTPSYPAEIPSIDAGGSMIQRLMGNKKLLIALAIGVGLFFYMKTQKTARSA